MKVAADPVEVGWYSIAEEGCVCIWCVCREEGGRSLCEYMFIFKVE